MPRIPKDADRRYLRKRPITTGGGGWLPPVIEDSRRAEARLIIQNRQRLADECARRGDLTGLGKHLSAIKQMHNRLLCGETERIRLEGR